MPRDEVTSVSIAMTSTILRLCYFTARKTEAITQVRLWSGGVAAGATPTVIRVGWWTADAAGALLALVAATAHDATLLAGLNTAYTKSFAASGAKVRGTRYACGLLVVTGATVPQVTGSTAGAQGGIMGAAPARCMSIAGQSDLPPSVAAGSLTASVSRPYFILMP